MDSGSLDEADLAELHRLVSAAARKAGAGDDAADVAQETFIRLDKQGTFRDFEISDSRSNLLQGRLLPLAVQLGAARHRHPTGRCRQGYGKGPSVDRTTIS